MSSTVDISVIIVTCNSEGSIGACLQSLQPAASGRSHQVIVVDNASTDRTMAQVDARCPDAVTVRNTKNLGFASACNQGALAAKGEWLVFVNPDVILDPASLDRLIEIAAQHREAGMVTMRLRNPDGTFQANCRNFPTVTNLLFSRGSVLGRLLWRRFNPRTTTYTLPDYPKPTKVPAVSATAAAIRRELYQKTGGFDRRYFLFMEDTDICYRLALAGYHNFFVPSAGAVHQWGQGAKSGRFSRSWNHHQSVLKYFLKFQPTGFALVVLPAILAVNFALSLLIPKRRA